jgi:3-deoxy-D-manno-octulosonate 8-phosphate phosphatase (KDO 8-P phosphatase)
MYLLQNINYMRGARGEAPLAPAVFEAMGPAALTAEVEATGMPFYWLLHIDLATRKALLTDKPIRLLVLDVDGVLTDGGMHYTSDGHEVKRFHVKDGMGITQAIKKGLTVGIISAALRSEVTEHRARMLGIQRVYVGQRPKDEVLRKWLEDMHLDLQEVAYIGDDINDVALLRSAGVSAAPADAHASAKAAAKWLLRSKGGEGCVREFIDTFINI